MGLKYQIIGTGILCLLSINVGVTIIWPACVITLFSSENTTLNRPMTQTEISLLGSLSAIGALVSTLSSGFLVDKLGRKTCSILGALGLIIFWLILAISNQVEVLLIAVFWSGITSAAFPIASIYASEICQDSLRGTLTSCITTSWSLGMLLLYILGGYLSYNMMVYIGIIMTAVSAMLLCLIKDSPVYLLKIGKEKEAAKAIAYFRQLKVDDIEVTAEIKEITHALNPELNEAPPELEKFDFDFDVVTRKLTFWQFMKKSRSTRRALFLTIMIVGSSIFQGLIVAQTYIDLLFTNAVPSVSSVICSIVMAAVVVVSGIIAAYLSDVIGRRPLLIYGSIGAGVSCVIIGTQLQLHWGPTWVTGIFIFVYPIMYTFGAGTIPMVLEAELFLPEVKGILSMLAVEWSWLCYFCILFIFNPLFESIGWGPVFYIFAIMCFLTAIFSFFFLPETKGLTVYEIQKLFLKKSFHHQ